MKTDTEAQLIEAAQGGDVESFGVLYGRYYGPIKALAWSMLGDHHLAEDAAQQTFAVACGALGRLRSREKFGWWLAGICRNTARQMARAQSKTTLVETWAGGPEFSGVVGDNGTVQRAIRQLPVKAREVIVLRYYDNLPYDRIGAVLGISESAVHGRLIRAKRKMKKYLKLNGYAGK